MFTAVLLIQLHGPMSPSALISWVLPNFSIWTAGVFRITVPYMPAEY